MTASLSGEVGWHMLLPLVTSVTKKLSVLVDLRTILDLPIYSPVKLKLIWDQRPQCVQNF